MSTPRTLFSYTMITTALISTSIQAPPQPRNTTILSPHLDALTLPSLLNTTTPPSNHSLPKSTYECIPDFAPGLLPASCQNLIPNSLLDPEDDTPKTWGPRGGGPGYTYDFPVPQRIISSDGNCMLEVFKDMWDRYETVSQKAFAEGANEMIEACMVNTDEPMGGVARNLGNANMDIDLVKAKPQIQCHGDPETPNVYRSCIMLMNEMKTWFQDARFGSGDDVDVRLPYTEISSDGKCAYTISSDGNDDTERYDVIWREAVTYIVYMCASQGRRGWKSSLGENGHLMLEMGAAYTPMIDTS